MFGRPRPLPRGNPVVYASMSLKEWHNILRGCKIDKYHYHHHTCINIVHNWYLGIFSVAWIYWGLEWECNCYLPLKVLYLLFWKQNRNACHQRITCINIGKKKCSDVLGQYLRKTSITYLRRRSMAEWFLRSQAIAYLLWIERDHQFLSGLPCIQRRTHSI